MQEAETKSVIKVFSLLKKKRILVHLSWTLLGPSLWVSVYDLAPPPLKNRVTMIQQGCKDGVSPSFLELWGEIFWALEEGLG